MSEILLAVDGDEERAEAQANALVDLDLDREAVTVTILHVATKESGGASVHQIGAVRDARDILEDHGFEVVLNEGSGDVAERIVRFADDMDADLVCLAGRKRSPAGKTLFGSVTQDVFLETDRPILLCGTVN